MSSSGKTTLIWASALLILVYVLLTFFRHGFYETYEENGLGFESVECWFETQWDWPTTECYYIHVPENHASPNGRKVAFPVVVFRSRSILGAFKSPVLHLGAGGPGAPIGFDYADGVRTLWEYHDEMSLNQGRDLLVMDPRGTGLSIPLLMCDQFVENETKRLNQNLSIRDAWTDADKDYLACTEHFQNQGVELQHYNSLAIAQDVEFMRQAANVEQWVLVGVSYGAVYAQILASQFPHSVESMVLDSAAFPNVQDHDNFIETTMSSYWALFDYCSSDPDCEAPIYDVPARIWRLYELLNQNPLSVDFEHPYKDERLPVLLNGERFLASLFSGIYGEDIFKDLPTIITELEMEQHDAISPYLYEHVYFMLDKSYGDVSDNAHYCFESKPFNDLEVIRSQLKDLPKGYIRDVATMAIDWPDLCDEMRVTPGPDFMAHKVSTDIPTLFLHGRLDTVTRLQDVQDQISGFSRGQLVEFELSHDVLSSDECGEYFAAEFIRDVNKDLSAMTCD